MITLQAHVGTNIATKVPCDLKQDRIFLDGKLIGYVGRRPEQPINLIVRDLPEEVTGEIRTAVAGKYGDKNRKLVQPPAIPPELLDAGEEDLEDEG
jgi:hypothetical protein